MQLVDTNVLSELMRQQPDAGVLLWLEGRQRVTSHIKISAITVDEIMVGLAWSPSVRLQRWFDAFLKRNEVLPITPTLPAAPENSAPACKRRAKPLPRPTC